MAVGAVGAVGLLGTHWLFHYNERWNNVNLLCPVVSTIYDISEAKEMCSMYPGPVVQSCCVRCFISLDDIKNLKARHVMIVTEKERVENRVKDVSASQKSLKHL